MIIPTVLSPDKPLVLDYTQLYDPSNDENTGRYVVPVDSLIWKGNRIFKVTSVDAITSQPTLTPGYLDTDDGDTGITSIISFGNDILRLYIDNRSLPYRVQVDPAVIFIGGSPSFYTLTRYSKSNPTVISKYYDSTGKYVKDQVPILPINNSTTNWNCDSCAIDTDLNDDEEILLTVYNEIGAEIKTALLLVKHSSIINDSLTARPRVVSLDIISPQRFPDGTIFLYEKQDPSSLNIFGRLTYNDGTTRDVAVDGLQTYLYGVEDIVAAYSGMLQNITMKYFFGLGETTATSDPTNQSITTTGTIKIIANKEAAPVKVSVIPVFNQALQTYNLRFYLYTTSRDRVVDVTSYTVVPSDAFNGSDYVKTQQFDFSVDLTKVDPTLYTGVATYAQSVCIKLLPPSNYIRWTISDSISSPYLYGADNTTDRRPILYYDKSKRKYFIPSSIFTTKDAVIKSFYKDANPPYDTRTEGLAPTPDKFCVRDPFSGTLLSDNPLSDFTKGFDLSNASDYTDQTVIVEFHTANSDNDLILYGVPVDVRAGTLTE